MLPGVKNFIITFCVSILIFGLIAYLIVTFAAGSLIGTSSPVDPDNTGEITGNVGPGTTDPVITTDIEGTTFTALLIGTDYQPDIFSDYDVSNFNQDNDGFPVKARPITADMILLVRVDKEDQAFIFSSLPANMQVTVDGIPTSLGAVYSEKGIDFFCELVKSLTGYTINYYAAASISDFAAIIDLADGISYTVPTDMYYEDTSEGLVIDLKKGKRTLNGAEALQMLRYNAYTDGNLSRMTLTLDFLKALAAKMTSPAYLDRAPELFRQMSSHLTTNFTSADLTANLELIFAYTDFSKIDITYPGNYRAENGVTYFVPQTANAISLFLQYR